MCVYAHACVQACTCLWHTCGGQRTTFSNLFSPFTLLKQSLSHRFCCCSAYSRLSGLQASELFLPLPSVSLEESPDAGWMLNHLPFPDLSFLFPRWSTMSTPSSPIALSFPQSPVHHSNVDPFQLPSWVIRDAEFVLLVLSLVDKEGNLRTILLAFERKTNKQ